MSKCVGKNVPRFDGFEKVTGQTKYIDDMNIPGCWFGGVIRSPIPYGRIRKIEFKKAFDWQGVVTVTHKDIPGRNATMFITEEQPILAEEVVRHIGEAVVLVAAPTKELVKKAVANVEIEYKELIPVLSIEESRSRKEIIWGDDNIQDSFHIEKGDVEKGFDEADLIVEGEYRTGFQEHVYIEPQGIAAIPRKDGRLSVIASCQCPYYLLKTLKTVLAMDESVLHVVQAPMGGAFGGKEEYPSVLGSYVALLAHKAGKPVKIVYSRDEDIYVTPKRHPSIVTHKTGVKRDGTITAMKITFDMLGGAYTTVSQVVLSRGVIHSAGPYKCENVDATATCWATNHVPNGAFRGFGAPQVFFALETHIDKIAEKIGMNPYEFRLKNCVHLGDTLATSQILRESVAAEEVLNAAVKASDFEKKWKEYDRQRTEDRSSKTKKGIGLSLYMHGGAFTGSGEAIMKSQAGLRLEKDGKVSVLMGCTDMGQGAFTVIPQIAADALGLPVENVSCVVPDTAVVPDSGPTVASRTTMIVGSVMEKCAITFRQRLCEYVAKSRKMNVGEVEFREGLFFRRREKIADFKKIANEYLEKKGGLEILDRYTLPDYIKWDAKKHKGDAYPAYSWAADIAEVTADTETFEVSVDKMTVVVELGKAINPILCEGQMEGGTLQALGYGLMEEAKYSEKGGIINNRFQTYIIPTVKDTPAWKTVLLEDPCSAGPQGAKGIGELPHDGGAPAIANAIYNAIGIRVDRIPITPEKLFEESKKKTATPGVAGHTRCGGV